MPHPDKLIFERAQVALVTAIALRFWGEGRRGFHAEKVAVLLNVVAHGLRAVVLTAPPSRR